MPTDQYLTEEQAVVFGRFVGEPSQAELEQFFYLDAADLERIAGRRGDHNRLGFALQVGTVRFLGGVAVVRLVFNHTYRARALYILAPALLYSTTSAQHYTSTRHECIRSLLWCVRVVLRVGV